LEIFCFSTVSLGGHLETRFFEVYNQVMNNWSSCSAVERDSEKVSGVWVFRGTRVPVSALFENLEDGVQLSDFLAWFPGVTAQQARVVLEHAAHTLEAV